MKKIVLGSLVVIIALLGAVFVFRGPLFLAVMSWQIAPDHDFAAARAPAAPDYANEENWAALPDKADPSDQIPPSFGRISTNVPVFFLHPTSFMSGESWNQPLDHAGANWIVDERILRHQASVFNSCCDVYAPRYRQATFFSFMDDSGNGAAALALAYTDVERAFDDFLGRIGADQPFVLAGHSQGSRHATKLLAEHIAGTPLQTRLVAAYLIGFSVTADQLNGVPVCSNAESIGCAIGWNAIDGPGSGAFGSTPNLLCVNPLHWRYDESHAPNELNRGAIGYPTYGPAQDGEDISDMTVEPGAADAQCQGGQLVVGNLTSQAFPSRMLGNSMHIYDYSLYHGNIRENVAQRVIAYLGGQNFGRAD